MMLASFLIRPTSINVAQVGPNGTYNPADGAT